MRYFEELINNPKAPGYMKFKAEILLLFDRYDPHKPESTITPEQFYGTLMLELMNLNFYFNSVLFDGDIKRPPFTKTPKKDEKYMRRYHDRK